MVVDRRFRKTEKSIVESMVKLLNKKEFNSISLNSLILEADINRSTFYLHFSSLDDLYKHILDNCVSLVANKVHNHIISESGTLSVALIELVFDNKILFKAALSASNFYLVDNLILIFEDFFSDFKNGPPLTNQSKKNTKIDIGSLVCSGVYFFRYYLIFYKKKITKEFLLNEFNLFLNKFFEKN